MKYYLPDCQDLAPVVLFAPNWLCSPMSPEPPTYIIASCTDRKRGPIPEGLHLGAIENESTSVRARKWWERLNAHTVVRQPAEDLYCGEHWSLVLRSLKALTGSGIQAELWVSSAGYGLIPSSAPLCPYSATFTHGAADSVTRGTLGAKTRPGVLQAWWACLAQLPGPDARGCRSLQTLTAKTPHSALILVASPNYIRAMRHDLLAAREALNVPERLVVISNRELSSDVELSQHLIPVDDRCRTVLGGTMNGLNARVALSLLEWGREGPLIVPRLRKRYDDMVRDAERPPKPNREDIDDKDVLTFLRAELARDPRTGWTPLHRMLLDGNRACGQRRFKALHQQVHDELTRPSARS